VSQQKDINKHCKELFVHIRGFEAMGESGRHLEKSSGSLPNAEKNPQSLIDAGRRAATTTEWLCGLYVMVTMNMDLSLIRYYVQSGELQKWLKKQLSNGKTIAAGKPAINH
jgi:hypothetical protein